MGEQRAQKGVDEYSHQECSRAAGLGKQSAQRATAARRSVGLKGPTEAWRGMGGPQHCQAWALTCMEGVVRKFGPTEEV